MRLLLDGHIAPAVARRLGGGGVDICTLDEWHDGAHRHHDDETILAAAAEEGRTLVTYDEQTFPTLLRAWAADARSHAGVIFVNNRTIRQQDVGGLIRALRILLEERGDEDWRDQVGYLRPA